MWCVFICLTVIVVVVVVAVMVVVVVVAVVVVVVVVIIVVIVIVVDVPRVSRADMSRQHDGPAKRVGPLTCPHVLSRALTPPHVLSRPQTHPRIQWSKKQFTDRLDDDCYNKASVCVYHNPDLSLSSALSCTTRARFSTRPRCHGEGRGSIDSENTRVLTLWEIKHLHKPLHSPSE